MIGKENSKQKIENRRKRSAIHHSLLTIRLNSGFTLIETLVAVSLLSVAIVAPMTLTSKSLSAAYYARDQFTAFHLAQEAVEAVRHVRDGNILRTSMPLGTPTDVLYGILEQDQLSRIFTIDTRDDSIVTCEDDEPCPPLQLDPSETFYGYDSEWTDSNFTRTVLVETVRADGDVPQEVRVVVTVSWQAGALKTKSVIIRQNLYRWVNDAT